MNNHRQIFSGIFMHSAHACVQLTRDDSDSYIYKLDLLTHGCSLGKQDLAVLLPVGSQWIQSVNWHAYSGIPFVAKKRPWIGVGFEKIERHASRGAYPSYIGYIFPLEDVPISHLHILISKIASPETADAPPTSRRNLRHTVLRGAATDPEGHTAMEVAILNEAIRSYSSKTHLLFCTLALAESQVITVMNSAHSRRSSESGIFCDKSLISTVPSIERTFSDKVRSWIDYQSAAGSELRGCWSSYLR